MLDLDQLPKLLCYRHVDPKVTMTEVKDKVKVKVDLEVDLEVDREVEVTDAIEKRSIDTRVRSTRKGSTRVVGNRNAHHDTAAVVAATVLATIVAATTGMDRITITDTPAMMIVNHQDDNELVWILTLNSIEQQYNARILYIYM
jgi:hypothetical protein